MGLFTLWITNFNFTPFLVLSKNVVLRFFVANILHRTVLHCILNDSHKYCCHFSMKTCSCPSRNDDPLKFIKLIWSIGHTKFRFIFFSRLFNVTWNRQLRPIWPNGLFQFYIFQSPVFLYNLFQTRFRVQTRLGVSALVITARFCHKWQISKHIGLVK